MADFQLGTLHAVQPPNYSGIGALYAQGGTNLAGFGANLASGIQQGRQNAVQQQQLGMEQQKMDMLAQSQAVQQKSALMDQQVKLKSYMADQAYSIQQLPADQREGAYKLASLNMVKNGIVQPNEVPDWSQGGDKLTQQMAAQSPLGLKAEQLKLTSMKDVSAIQLQQAQIKAANINAAAKAQESGLNPDGTPNTNSVGGGKPLTAQDAKALNSATSTLQSVAEMRKQLGDGDGSLLFTHWPRFAQDSSTQKLGDLQDQLSASVGTMIGSNRLSEAQQKIARELIPGAADNPQIRMEKLDKLETLANNMAKGIRPYTNTQPGVAPAAQSLMSQNPGLTPQQAQAILSKRGNQ